MDAVPVALPQALQNCAPEPIGDPHLSQNIDRSSVSYRYARRARKVSFGDPPIAIKHALISRGWYQTEQARSTPKPNIRGAARAFSPTFPVVFSPPFQLRKHRRHPHEITLLAVDSILAARHQSCR